MSLDCVQVERGIRVLCHRETRKKIPQYKKGKWKDMVKCMEGAKARLQKNRGPTFTMFTANALYEHLTEVQSAKYPEEPQTT